MLTDRLVKLFLGAIAVLLMALVLQSTLQSPHDAQAALNYPDTEKFYSAKLVSEIAIDNIEEVIPLEPDGNGVNFIVRTSDSIMIYRCSFYTKEVSSGKRLRR